MKKEKVKSDNVLTVIDESISKGEFNYALDLIRRFKIGKYTVTKKKLKHQYKLKDEQLTQLGFIEVKNPHYSGTAPMKLFLIAEAELVFNIKIEINETKRPK